MNIKAGFFVRRVLLLIPLLFGLSVLTFSISRVVPGDPVGLAAGPQATPEIKETLRREFGLDKSLPVQYYRYVSGLFHGDWGESLYSRRAVADDLGNRDFVVIARTDGLSAVDAPESLRGMDLAVDRGLRYLETGVPDLLWCEFPTSDRKTLQTCCPGI